MTQNQLTELFESDQVKALIERSEERGWVEPTELEAFVLEHDLNDDEAEQVTRELETIGLEVGQPPAAAAAAEERKKEEAGGCRLGGRGDLRRGRLAAAVPRGRRHATSC